MACQMIWLFGYLSLGLALTLGNRPNVHVNQRPQVRSRYEQPHPGDNELTGDGGGVGQMVLKKDKAEYRYDVDSVPYDLPPDWVVYDKNAWNLPDKEVYTESNNNNAGIIDDFASAVIETLYPTGRKKNDKLISDFVDRGVVDRRTGGRGDDDESDTALPINNYYELAKKRARSGRPIDDSWRFRDDDRSTLVDEYGRSPGKRNYGSASGRRRATGEVTRSTSQQNQGTPPIVVPQANNAAASVGSIASQFMLRAARGNRQYDVPQIECPSSEDGMERFACPTPDRMGRYRCIDDHVLCDGFIDCPNGEDEDRQGCMFYKTTKAHLDVLADALLRWVRGR